MKTRHVRTVQIATYTVTCDHCGVSPPTSGRDALHTAGWTLGASEDICPDCHAGLEREALRRETERAFAAYIESVERGTVPLVHGRMFVDSEDELPNHPHFADSPRDRRTIAGRLGWALRAKSKRFSRFT